VRIDWRRLRRGELLAGASAVLLLVAMFVNWYGIKLTIPHVGSAELPTGGANAWDAFTVVDVYLLLTLLVALALVVAQAALRAPAVPVSLDVITSVLGTVAVVLVLWRSLDPPGVSGVPAILASHVSRTLKAGAFLGLAATIGITVGAFQSLRQEGVLGRDGPGEIKTVHLS
jgi:divalent metal cation (Fe/Co/Zn/Cd) transporter